MRCSRQSDGSPRGKLGLRVPTYVWYGITPSGQAKRAGLAPHPYRAGDKSMLGARAGGTHHVSPKLTEPLNPYLAFAERGFAPR